MIYIENNLKKQDVFVPRNDTTICYVSPYDKGYQDGYQDGIEDCGGCHFQQKEVVLTATTETISPDQDYDGMDSVFVDARQLALENYHEGEDEQKSKLETTTFDRNGEYTREDGWSAVTVDVPKDINLGTLVESPQMSDITYEYYIKTFDPQEASVDGWGEVNLYMGTLIGESKNEQKALMTATTFTQNGLYRREDGWNEVIVEVPQTGTSCNLESKTETVTADTQTILHSSGYDGMSEVVVDATDYGQDKYDEGFTDGQTDILSGLTDTTIRQNGSYSNHSGWSGVTVDVQPTLEAASYALPSGFTGATIVPSSGYDGMSSVVITDGGYGQEKYDEGYQDGQGSCPAPNLEQKSVTLTATTETVTPSQGYDGMDEVSIDATSIYDRGFNDGYNTGEQSFGTEIIPDSSVTITQYGTYYFVYDSSTTVSAMTVHFGTTPRMPAQFKVQLYNIRENINGPLYNLSASTASLVRIEIDDVVFTGTTYTGLPTRIDYYFNDYIPEAFFSSSTIAADVIVLGLTNTGSTITVNRNAFTDSTLSAIAFQKGNYLIKENAIYNTVMGAVTFWKSNITVETNGITHNTNLHFIQFGQGVSFTADGTAFYESTTLYPNDRRVGIVYPITTQYIRQQAWYINNLEPDGWRIVDYT